MKLIKQKDFLLLILGKLVSLFGSNMQQFALSLYVLALTGSATIFASMLSITIIPRLLLSPIAGVFGDWFDRKKSIVILDMINAMIIGIYAVIFTIRGTLTLPMIYVLVILLEITEIFFHSAMAAVIPSMIEKDKLMEANSFNSLVMSIGQLIAPILGAALYGVFGLKVILIVNSISFLLSSISEMFINIPKKHKKPEKIDMKSFKDSLMEGVGIIKSNKIIYTMISLGTLINFSISPVFSVGLIYILKEVLKATDFQIGLFETVVSLSMILAPIIGTRFIKKMKIGNLCYLSFVFIGIVIFIMSLIPSKAVLNSFSTSFIPYIFLIFTSFSIGVLATIANIALGTIFDQVTPVELLGRTSTIFNLAVTIFIPIGQMLFGFLYDIISPSYVIVISGVILILSVIKYRENLLKADEDKNVGDVVDEL